MKKIGKDKSGMIGEWVGGYLTDLFTGEPKEVAVADVKEVGFLEMPKHLNSVKGSLFKQKMMGLTATDFYLLGNVSARAKLRYVRLNETILMGFSDNHNTPNGNVYYFRKCGEIDQAPVFTYLSDMVIKENEIVWVHPGEHTHVPNR